jgi:GGDEF domain-containing protein
MQPSSLPSEPVALAPQPVIDPPTGLLDRQSFVQLATAALARLDTALEPAALLVLDQDGFALFNRAHGHAEAAETPNNFMPALR